MGPTLYEALAHGDSRSVQAKGAVTLPKEWRDKHGIEQGDIVGVIETDDGTLEVLPPE